MGGFGLRDFHVGLAGPAFLFCLFGVVVTIAVARLLPADSHETSGHGAAASYPSIGGQSSGASVTAAVADRSTAPVGFFDPRIRVWIIVGLVLGHAQAMTGQTVGFLVIDRLGVDPVAALQPTGLVLMMGAGAALLAQWGLIPMLGLTPRLLVLIGLALSAAGCLITGFADSMYGIALGYALASLGFGFSRPGFTAGASLAVGAEAQGSVAGKVTSINGASFILGPSVGVALYQAWFPLPYAIASAALVAVLAYAIIRLRLSDLGPGASPAQ
jgi:hypothetical protein